MFARTCGPTIPHFGDPIISSRTRCTCTRWWSVICRLGGGCSGCDATLRNDVGLTVWELASQLRRTEILALQTAAS
eukprot:COSAG01_NODE_3328_length_6249_cov_3.493821_3_plen_76_part_00